MAVDFNKMRQNIANSAASKQRQEDYEAEIDFNKMRQNIAAAKPKAQTVKTQTASAPSKRPAVNTEERDSRVRQAYVNRPKTITAKKTEHQLLQEQNFLQNIGYELGSSEAGKQNEQQLETIAKDIALERVLQREQKQKQTAERLNSYNNLYQNGDFANYSKAGKSKISGTQVSDDGFYVVNKDDPVYDYINDINGYRKSSAMDSVMSGNKQDPNKVYSFMSDEQVKNYNYLYAKEGKDSADRYLSSIREQLNYSAAAEQYDGMKGNTLKEIAYGANAGADRFASGIKQLFQEDAVDTSQAGFVGQMAREGLSDTGPKVFGNSLGQAGYDILSTAANMAPSILLSAVLGGSGLLASGSSLPGAAGSALMGSAAGGNAYAQKRKEGYTAEQARTYGTLIGASEGALQYALGGISALGGGEKAFASKIIDIDNAAARIALSLGGNMLSEGFEEGLQEVLEPVIANVVLNEENSVDFENVAYAALLGALTAGVLEGPNTVYTELNSPGRGIAVNALKQDGYLGGTEIDYFQGVTDLEALKAAQRELAKMYHPDQASGNSAIMKDINRQYSMMKAFFEAQETAQSVSPQENAQEDVYASAEEMYQQEEKTATEPYLEPQQAMEEITQKSEQALQFVETPVVKAEPLEQSIDKEAVLNEALVSGLKNEPVDDILKKYDGSVPAEEILAKYKEGLVGYNKTKKQGKTAGNKPKFKAAVKKDWASHDVEWAVPWHKRPVAYSTKAASDLIGVLSDDNPTVTIVELRGMVNYDAEAKTVLDAYINNGYGKQVASEWFAYNKNRLTERKDLVERTPQSIQTTAFDIPAITKYQSSEAYTINEALYTNRELTREEADLVQQMDGELETLPKYKGTVYRNITFDLQGEEAYTEFLALHEPGWTVKYLAYTSTSKLKDGYEVGGNLVVHFEIDGVGGRDTTGSGGRTDEQEVIFERGSRFVVAKVATAEDGKPLIELKEAIRNEGKTEGNNVFSSELRPSTRNAENALYADSVPSPVQGVQAHQDGEMDVYGLSSGDTRGNRRRGLHPQQALSGGQRGTVRESGNLSPSEVIANRLTKYIEKGTAFSPAKLYEIADEAFGGTMAEGAYTIKDVYDAMELSVNRFLIEKAADWNGTARDAGKRINSLENLLSKLPTQTKRTAEMESFQQFSTPPNIAYIAAWAANIDPSDVVLEPSAGIGGLALWGKAWGAEVHGNELSERRFAILQKLGLDGVTNLNAEQIDNLLDEAVKPSVVIMNPPFSSTAGRTAKNSTKNATRHIEQALDRLEDGGRLVAILGKGMSDDAPAFKKWWADMKKKYNVRANIQIDGKNYKKYGTSWDVQLVIIDKNGATSETLTGTYENIQEIPKLLEAIRNDRTRSEQNTLVTSSKNATVSTDGGRAVRVAGDHADAGRSDGGGMGTGRADGGRPESVGGVHSVENVQRTSVQSNDGRGSTDKRSGVSETGKSSKGGAAEGGTGKDEGVRSTAEVDRGNGMQLAEPVGVGRSGITDNPDSVYAAYTPKRARVKGAKKHPAKLVESAAMAAVDPPDATYVPSLPQSLIESGALSDAQLENIIYAGQSHEKKLPNGTRRGYFIGDGTGVGKGRQAAGIIIDNYNQGRKKAVWISKNKDLLPDAKRDLSDLGYDPNNVVLQNKFKGAIDLEEGVIFTPFDTLKMGLETGGRIKQLVDWLGKDFDGVIILDEAHNMGNAVSVKGKRGKTKPAAKALAGLKIQDELPNARIVYASATGAEKVSDYAYLKRLGLWGEGTAFHDVNDFIEKISAGGLAAMELVARDMKAMGVYMARSISYEDVQYDTLEHKLTPMQKEIYDTASRAWQVVFQNINEALELTNANKSNERSSKISNFYSAQQRFYNQIITSMAMPSVVESIKNDLANGNSVVIQLVNTNAAAADREIEKSKREGTSLDDIDLTPKEALITYLKSGFPIHEFEEYDDEDGNRRARPVLDKDGNRVVSKKAVQMRDALIAQVDQMSIPDGPLEILLDAFGAEQVAEVTGRTRRLVNKKTERGETKRVVENRGPNSGLADAQMFQDGKKRILVFSDAGGTGKSYHADLRAKNQQHRVHYLLQAGWNASNATQGFGRTHRSNQASAPTVRLVTTDIMGQKRFTATVARRLDQLGALTKGQRQAGSGVFSEKDNLENKNASDTLANFYRTVAPDTLKKMGLYNNFYNEYGQYRPDETVAREIGKFLNRILSLEVDEQNDLFNRFFEQFEADMDKAIREGTVDTGLENVVADKIEVVDETTIRKDGGTETKYVQLKAFRKPSIIKYDSLKNRQNFQGLVRMEDGSVRAVYRMSDKTQRDGSVTKQYRLLSPVQGQSSTFVQKTLDEKTTPIATKDAKAAWREEIAKAPKYTEETMHLLTGSLLPIWDRLPTENTRVVRVLTNNGQYLGRLIRSDQIDAVLRGFNANRTKETFQTNTVIERVLNGETAILEKDKQRLERHRVSGEVRIELVGPNVWYVARNIPGLIQETIQYKTRYFIPTGEKGLPILERLLSQNPVLEMRSSANEDVDAMKNSPENGWIADRAGEEKTPMQLRDLVNKMRKDFDIPISTGHVSAKGALGEHQNKAWSIRTKVANDIYVISHELGHHMANKYGMYASMPPAVEKELVNNLDPIFKEKYKEHQLKREGLAEFIREYLRNAEEAEKKYPKASQMLFETLSKDDMKKLNFYADEINAYFAYGAGENGPSLSVDSKGEDFRTIGEKATDKSDNLYQAWVDSNHGIKKFSRAADDNRAYVLATNSAYADSVSHSIIFNGLTDTNGKPIGKSLAKALESINMKDKQEYSDFNDYLVVRHGPEYLEEGLMVFADPRLNNAAWMEKRQRELEAKYPHFKEASENLYAFKNDFLYAWGVDTGLISSQAADAMIKRWPNHVPFYRADIKGAGDGGKRGYANQGSTIHKAKGSGRAIINPVENTIEYVVRMVNAGTKNKVMLQLADTANTVDNLGTFMEKVPAPVKAEMFDGKGLKEKLMNAAMQEAGVTLDEKGVNSVFEVVNQNIDDILVQYGRGKAGGDVVTVLRNGKPEFWKINDPMLLDSLTSLSQTKLPAVLEAYGRLTRFITGNITGNNIVWSVFSNLPRDLMTFYTYSNNKNQLKLFGGIAKAYLEKVNGGIGKEQDPLYQEYMAMGGGSISAYTAEKNRAKGVVNQLKGKSGIAKYNPMAFVEFASDMIESGPRFAYYRILREQGETPQDAFYGAMDVTTNFRRSGSYAKQVNKIVPFFNANAQGLDRFARWISADDVKKNEDRGKAVKSRATMFVVVSLALASLMILANGKSDEDEENYKQLSTFTKNSFWNIPLGDGKYFAIPKPREIAVLSSGMERLMELYLMDNQDAFRGFYGYATDQALPPVLSELAEGDVYGSLGNFGIFGTIAYMSANRDFRGNPIVSRGLETLMPKAQFDQRTTKIAKVIGDAFNISPKKLDFFLNNTLGVYQKVSQALFPVGDESRDFTLGVKNSYIKDNQYSTDLINSFYDEKDNINKESKTYPDDFETKLKNKEYNDMATFYSRYSALSKNQPESAAKRKTRQTVLDMFWQFKKEQETGVYSAGMDRLQAFSKEIGATNYYPSVMENCIKISDDKATKANEEASYSLTDAQYVQFQTEYNRLYWEGAESALQFENPEKAKAALGQVKTEAKKEAERIILNKIGVSTHISFSDHLAKYDSDGNGSYTQEETISALRAASWLTQQEKHDYYADKWARSKNNPF